MRVIKGYKLQEKIGAGGFGEVYHARQLSVEREVAIKLILPKHANEEEFIQRFKIEAQLIANLEHPHIVPLYDYWRDPSGAYLVMRWLRGGSVADSLLVNGPWDVEATGQLLREIAGALSVAHRNEVVHQDIKPANILLDEDGYAYLTDFGIARIIRDDINLAEDPNNVMHGSPAYISPEHLQHQPITHKSDIYSLGILIYEVLTGEGPYPATEIMELLTHHLKTPLPSLTTQRPDIPAVFDEVIKQATVKNPASRYDSVLDMAQHYQDILNTLRHNNTKIPPVSVAAAQISDAVHSLPIEIPNPYKGLRAFHEADAKDFFGRDDLVRELLRRLAEHHEYQRFLAVIGPSGSGKSSVVRAGLLPAIRRGDLMGLPGAFIADMTPGTNPMRSLETAILQLARRADDQLVAKLQRDDFELAQVLRQSLPDNAEMILFIDQFEEVFTLVDDEALRNHFLNTLYRAVTQEASHFRLLITLRADFYDRPLYYAGWSDLFQDRSQVVPPLSELQLKQAITAPADRVGLDIQSGLVELMASDVGNQVGSLPLMQYALAELFERKKGVQLTIDDYNAMGGISGALANRAEELYTKKLTGAQQAAARQMFPRLIKLGEGTEDTRQRALQPELTSLSGGKQAIQDVIDIYVKYRLLTSSNETVRRVGKGEQDDYEERVPTVEIAHEALIRSWGRLNQWLNDNREALQNQARLSSASNEWLINGKDESYLASGARLAQFEELLADSEIALTAGESAFVTASIHHATRNERLRQRVIAILIFLLVVSGVALVGVYTQSQITIRERNRANAEAITSRSRELAASAQTRLDTPDTSLLLSLQAIATENNYQARNSLLLGLQQHPRLLQYLNGHTDFVRAASSSPDGTQFATAGRDQTIILWDANTLEATQLLRNHDDWINTLAYSPDGRWLASGDRIGRTTVWDLETGEIHLQLEEDYGFNAQGRPIRAEIWSAVFSNDDDRLFVADSRGNIIVYDTQDGTQLNGRQLINAQDDGGNLIAILAAAMSPDGALLATADNTNSVRLWDTDTLEPVRTLSGHHNWVLDLLFSPDGNILYSASADQTIIAWDVATGDIAQIFEGHNGWVRTLALFPGGNTLVSGGRDGRVIVWNTANGQQFSAFNNIQQREVWDLILRDTSVWTAGELNSLNLWTLSSPSNLSELVGIHDQVVHEVAFAPDNATIAAAGGDAFDDEVPISLWNLNTSESTQLNGHTEVITATAYSGDQLISASTGGTVIFWENAHEAARLERASGLLSAATTADTMALGRADGQIEIWDISGDLSALENPTFILLEGTSPIEALAFDPAGRLLAAGNRDGSGTIWDIESGTQLGDALQGHQDGINTVAFSPDGQILATGSRDQAVILWDVATQAMIQEPLIGHSGWVNTVVFSPDGQLLASASRDRTIILWDVGEMRQLGAPFMLHTAPVEQVAFSPDGLTLLSGSLDTTVRLLDVNPDAWQSRACAIAKRELNPSERQQYFPNRSPLDICVDATSSRN